MLDEMIYVLDPYEDFPWKVSLKNMYDDGVRVVSYLTALPLAWDKPDGSFDFSLLDELQDEILAIAPDAKLLPRVFMTTPSWWDEKYPDELLEFDGVKPNIQKFPHENQKLWKYETKMYHDISNASVASEVWRNDAGNALKNYTVHLVERYGKNKIAAIQIAYGTCGEWGLFGSYKSGQFGNADFAPPMLKAFRKFLREKYGRNFDDALPPSKLERMYVEEGNLRTPKKMQFVTDYLTCAAQVQVAALRYFCRQVKEVDAGLICGSFGAGVMNAGSSCYMLHNLLSEKVEPLLMEIPELDFLSTPNSYFNRLRGIFSQAPAHSVAFHKTFIAECDVKTHYCNEPSAPHPSCDTNQFLLESGFNLASGNGKFWLYDFGKNWYQSPEIRNIIRKLNQIYPETPELAPQSEVAVVIDFDSLICSEGSMGYYRQFARFLYDEMPRSGVHADHIVYQDIFNLSPYKLYIFRDKFLSSKADAEKLRNFLETNNASAIFFGPAGCVSYDKIDFSQSHQLSNFNLQELKNFSGSSSITLLDKKHELLENLDLPFTLCGVEDINGIYAPLPMVTDGEILGVIESAGVPGLSVKSNGGRLDLWSASPILPAQLMRNLYRKLKISILAPPNVSVYGAGEIFVLRSDFQQTIKLNTGKTVNLITGEIYKSEILMEKNQTLLLKKI